MAVEETDENNVEDDNDRYKGYNHDVDRTEQLFKELDRNKDGKIDAKELAEGLKRLKVRHRSKCVKGQVKVNFKYFKSYILFMCFSLT